MQFIDVGCPVHGQGCGLPVAVHVTRVACWRKLVEISQVQFWDKVFTPVVAVCCRWPDSAGNCGDAAVSVFDQVDGHPCDLAATSSGEMDFLAPSTTQNCKSSRSGGGADAGNFSRCQATGVRLHN